MLATVLALAAIVLAEPPEPKGPPTKEELAAITERGRDLFAYDSACWHASDALMAKKPPEGSFDRYIARKTEMGWTVAFGKLNEAGDRFLIAFEATPGEKPDQYKIEAFDPPKEDKGFLLAAPKAVDLTIQEFTKLPGLERRRYNVAILPAPEGNLWVYFMPAQTKAKIWPLGGDARFLVSADGSNILERRRLHKSVIEVSPPDPDGNQQVAGMHTHILADVPEDTDVFHVLTRKPSVPEVIRTEHWMYVVEPDGKISEPKKADEQGVELK
ncbi:hypothetical protein [Singulisphaera sp. PoT]|uniref:hypothetical protein n=1 Tax=Singulisphaera sp. PoT TaxID=3411797 RepID=UPI003BF4A2C1